MVFMDLCLVAYLSCYTAILCIYFRNLDSQWLKLNVTEQPLSVLSFHLLSENNPERLYKLLTQDFAECIS